MRIGIVVDSTCDLPSGYIEANNVVLLPITVRIGDAMLGDHLWQWPRQVDAQDLTAGSPGSTRRSVREALVPVNRQVNRKTLCLGRG